ncbi:MAG: hypothetical protein L0Z50_25935 [Verrucomicrobiales bacterium]|nr:hypothetical protein [Verrucomicrobiales bacterium]
MNDPLIQNRLEGGKDKKEQNLQLLHFLLLDWNQRNESGFSITDKQAFSL